MRLFVGCVVGHVVLTTLFGPAWWVPDVTLVGMVLCIAASPARWLPASVLAGGIAALWAVRWTPLVFAGYLAIGWGLRQASQQWDAGDPRVRTLLVALAVTLLTGWLVWVDDLWSPAIVGALLTRVASSAGLAVFLQRMVKVA